MAAENSKPDATSMRESVAGLVHWFACKSAAETISCTETGCGASYLQWPWRSSSIHRLGVLVCCTYRSAPALIIELRKILITAARTIVVDKSAHRQQIRPSVRAPGNFADTVNGLNTALSRRPQATSIVECSCGHPQGEHSGYSGGSTRRRCILNLRWLCHLRTLTGSLCPAIGSQATYILRTIRSHHVLTIRELIAHHLGSHECLCCYCTHRQTSARSSASGECKMTSLLQ